MSEDLAAALAAVGEAAGERCAGDEDCSSIDHEQDDASAVTNTDADDWKKSVVEPEMEFDDVSTDIALSQELVKGDQQCASHLRCGAMTPDGLIDDDFEQELGCPSQEEERDPDLAFRDIAKFGILQIAGDDAYGRKVIVLSACRLPAREEIDHEKLLMYLRYTLDKYVENDYTVIYFHFGLCSANKPTVSWLKRAYNEFDRKYKKNLKALYLVHPTKFIKAMWNIFRPFISVKFGRKVTYVSYLHELAAYLPLDQLIIPQRVQDHDAYLLEKNKPRPVPTSIIHAPLPTQQFGVDLEFIKRNNGGDIIPPVLHQCVSFLREHGLETEGLFRRSATASVLTRVQQQFNTGVEVNFVELGNVHIPAAMLKSFLRQLPEPLLTYELHDHIIHVQSMEPDEKIAEMRRILTEELPDDNYFIVKYVVYFLTEVRERSAVNLMTADNLAVIFGPNLMWSKSRASLVSLGYINACTRLLITRYDDLFVK